MENNVPLDEGEEEEGYIRINYEWLANSTFNIASFLISVVSACRPHLEVRASSGFDGVRNAARFFENLRFRYINIVQRPRWTPAPRERAFDAAVYRLFFGGAVPSRPQQQMYALMPDRIAIVCYLDGPERALGSVQRIARVSIQLEQQICDMCLRAGIDSADLSKVQYGNDDAGDAIM